MNGRTRVIHSTYVQACHYNIPSEQLLNLEFWLVSAHAWNVLQQKFHWVTYKKYSQAIIDIMFLSLLFLNIYNYATNK
jgi:hypothetical protein